MHDKWSWICIIYALYMLIIIIEADSLAAKWALITRQLKLTLFNSK